MMMMVVLGFFGGLGEVLGGRWLLFPLSHRR